MKIKVLSDLHNEFSVYDLSETEDDKDTVLVLAGDIDLTKVEGRYTYFIENMTDRFKHVVLVCGNHEHYRTRIEKSEGFLTYLENRIDNFHFLDDSLVNIDSVLFIGGTLWTSMNNCDSLTMYQVELGLNDFRLISDRFSNGVYRKIRATDVVNIHNKTKGFIFGNVKKHKKDYDKVVVVTHHAPSFLSVSDVYRGQILNHAYASELYEDIMNSSIDLWCHGHVHNSNDYMVGNCRVVSNPRGYSEDVKGFENIDFDPLKTIEI